jgi:glucoamylase
MGRPPRTSFMKSTLLLAIAVFTTFASARSRDDGFDQWVASEQSIAVRSILQNVSPFDGLPGTVIASPEREAPDYYYHWVRDAALTMNTLFSLFEESPDHRSLLEQTFLDYNVLTRIQQKAHTRSGHGEPKFYVDGRGYDGDWCRPQNDGPALRAIVLTRIANHLRSHGQDALVRQNYYDAKIPTDSTIKADLEFVAHHWRETNCDLWEEVKGHHFYTRIWPAISAIPARLTFTSSRRRKSN